MFWILGRLLNNNRTQQSEKTMQNALVSLYLTMTQCETPCYMVAHSHPDPTIYYSLQYRGWAWERQGKLHARSITHQKKYAGFIRAFFRYRYQSLCGHIVSIWYLLCVLTISEFVNGCHKNATCNMSHMTLCHLCSYDMHALYVFDNVLLYRCGYAIS